MAAREMVFPGDEVAIAEEFLPGPGTYEENGNVYAARLGFLTLDSNEFVARVEPVTLEPSILRVGDTVIGVVGMMKASMCVVEVVKNAAEPDRTLGCDTNGTLHIGKVSESYVENLEDAYRPSDIIRAEVTSVDPSLQLSTKGAKFGVLKAFCPRCRTAYVRKDTIAVCPECDWKDPRKFAADFGEGHLLFEGPEPPPEQRGERRPRFGGGGGRGGGFRGGRDDRGGRGDRGGGRGGGFRGGRDDRRGRGGGERRYDDRPRGRSDSGSREDRPREDRPREFRPREDSPREFQPRDERPREFTSQADAPRGEQGGEHRRRRGRRGGRGRNRGGGGPPSGGQGGG
ncbi:MAG: exosome complex RNA-binding protein Csl4 [Thermoplasmatota archaeon]